MARALAADPPIMLMDEPFGAVDPIVRDRLQNEFLRLQETIAKTILFVTHDIDEAIKMGDLVAVFQTGGILAQFGSPLDILAAPASAFVARFVGQDRGLKRLSLLRVADLELRAADDRAASATRRRRAGDGRTATRSATSSSPTRPTGRSAGSATATSRRAAPLDEAMANPVSPLLNKRTTLKDALSMMLDADVQTGIVVDRTGAVQGLVTVDAIAGKMREGEHAAVVRRPQRSRRPDPEDRRPGPGRRSGRRRRPRSSTGSDVPPGTKVFDFGWVARPPRRDRRPDRPASELTAVPSLLGIVISLALAIWRGPPPR